MFYDDTEKSGNNEKINNFYHENLFAGFELVAYRMDESFDKYLRSWTASNLFYLTSFFIFSPFCRPKRQPDRSRWHRGNKNADADASLSIHTTFDIFLDDVNFCVPC